MTNLIAHPDFSAGIVLGSGLTVGTDGPNPALIHGGTGQPTAVIDLTEAIDPAANYRTSWHEADGSITHALRFSGSTLINVATFRDGFNPGGGDHSSDKTSDGGVNTLNMFASPETGDSFNLSLLVFEKLP